MRAHEFLVPALLLLASCGEPEDPVAEGPFVALEPRQELIRLSVDLRGIHPTEADLRAFDADPTLWVPYVDKWMDDPRFLARLDEIWNERFLMRTGDAYFDLEQVGLAGVDEDVMAERIAQEPLRLVRKIFAEDLPYGTIATADFTMADPMLAAMWDIEIPEGVNDWTEGHYRDGRPHAGILSMTTTWQRYPSMGGNANRHRANAISRMLLCEDYLQRPIVLNRAAVDALVIDPEDAINQNVGCQACHATLDPLSASLFGFFTYDEDNDISETVYRPENEEDWKYYAGKEPGWYGRPTSGLVELGQQIAEDSRFVDCAVETAWEGLTQRDIVDADWEEIRPHTDAFQGSDQNLRALIRSVLISDGYRAARATTAEMDERVAGVKVASPAQLAGIIEDLTGYRWTFDGEDGLTSNGLGLQVLTGGIDSLAVTRRTFEPSVGMVFVQERLAQGAGVAVAEHDLDPERIDEARLLGLVTVADTPDTARDAFDAQIRALYLDITGIPLASDATEPAELIELWKVLYSVEGSPTMAWGGVVSAVLRDPRVLFY